MNNKYPMHLAKIEASIEGSRKFVKEEKPYKEIIWGTAYNEHLFNVREEYFNKVSCDFNCPPNKEFFCCKEFGCKKHNGYFEWEEVSFFSDKEREEILSSWNNGTGFYRKDGCALPRKLRSYICLTYSCNHSKKKSL